MAFLLVPVSLTVGCGEGDGGGVDLADDPPVEFVLDDIASERLVEVEYSVVAVSGPRILIAGGTRPTGEQSWEVITDVVLVDRATGASEVVAGPVFDGTMATVGRVVGDGAGGFVAIGGACDAWADLGEDADCEPRHPRAHRLPPGETEWQRLHLPDELTPSDPGETWSLDVDLASNADGRVVAAVQASPVGGFSNDWQILQLAGDRWEDRGRVPFGSDICLTEEVVYVLGKDTSIDGGESASYSLVRMSIDDGALTEVPLPDGLRADFGGVGVRVACDQRFLHVATHTAPTAPAGASVFRWEAESWVPVLENAPALPTEALDGGRSGVVVRASEPDTGDRVWLVGWDESVVLDHRASTSLVLPDPGGDSVAIIGPLPHLDALGHEGGEGTSDPVVLLREVRFP